MTDELAGTINVSEDLSSISFVRGARFKRGMTDAILCGVGTLTAGQYMRETLHAALDEWIDKNLKENTKGCSAVVSDFTEANEEASKQIQSINRAIGVGQRRVTGDVINRKLIHPHKENT